MSDFPTLESPRLYLREIVSSDAPALFRIYSDAQVMRWFGSDPMTAPTDAQYLVNLYAGWRRMANPGTRWGLQLKGRDELIGTCGLFKWNRGWKNCTVGFELDRSGWGRGLMKEALATILPWGFEVLQVHRVEAQVHPHNAASLGLLSSLGFVREGLARQAGFWAGEHHDLVQMGLLENEYLMPFG